ncbi:unknown protein [Rivularia sp. IAM M-261]|nr:unknown protein [Rivularia sp. IAM M-261]
MEVQAKTRLLLALWDLGATKQEVKKGEVTRRIVTRGKKAGDYQGVFTELEEKGAIIVSKKGYLLAAPQGLEILSEGLRNPDFRFEGTIVGTWAANALLRWISEMNGTVASKSVFASNVNSFISSYDEFKSEILNLFEKLDKGHVYSGLVPIWHLREALGERVDRHKFNDWIMEMQTQKLLYLQSGEHRGATKEQKDASIESEIRGLLFYASQPS